MHLAISKLTIRMPESHTLKDKRRVANSLSSKLRNKYNIAIAEIETSDTPKTVTLGIACVSDSRKHAEQIMSNVTRFVEHSSTESYLVDNTMEIISGI